jgi:hypothetical protein
VDVASEIRAAFEIKAFGIVRLSRMIGTRMETFLDREYFEGSQNNEEVRGNYKLNPDRSEPTAVSVWRGDVLGQL